MKRFMDLCISSFGIIILSPLMVIISLLVLLSSPGGIFFRGERIGRNGIPFKILKFRSMFKDSEGNGKWNVSEDDPRITNIGNFLRKTKLDELPQLFCVFAGDMSIVGPRPELMYYVNMYTENEMPILDLKPGITDWASLANISQYKEFTKSDDPDQYYLEYIRPIKLHLQLYYRFHHSIYEDVKIILYTFAKTLRLVEKLPVYVENEIRFISKEVR